MITVTICATEKYAYALIPQARRVAAALSGQTPGTIILVGDDSCKPAIREYQRLLEKWAVKHIEMKGLNGNGASYKETAQLTIAQMRTAAFSTARALGADLCWSLDSDVLPRPNAFRCMKTMLEFDDGFYSVSTCPYPSQGGGGFLGGRGTPQHPILPDFYEDERQLPDDLKRELENARRKISDAGQPKGPEEAKALDALHKALHDLGEKAKACPPQGNVFAMNAKRYRRRGWFDVAYPGIGLGAVVPSDWCGFGCTLMNRKALEEAQFDGYDGKGTEDLYVVWWKWHLAGLRINVIAHCPADHVIRNPGKPGQYVLQQAFHERDGECVGHLRLTSRPFYTFTPGERHNPENDGILVPAKPPTSD